ncbi:LacI family DNA-binding transcriptional regulator [Microbacterium suwonense]|uniref:LacI family transcriptional regulator n=1 Tax=Microbacterium suwonense TaxID=683047 RepID=A0ABN6X9A7_9MICO|nr:LacI family DNA-binding transcriptional regulator [Microbacterium suwonense]BDZ40006.1 LacI family transcriptional regulator [Microbacterium suwonense]
MTIETPRGTTPWIPTLEEVAALAGVSSSTASRVINGSPRVTEQTVARVNEAIAKIGYVPNRAGRNLARRRTQTVAMMIPERTADFFADPYFAEVIQGAAMHASSTEYSLTLLIESEQDPHKTHQFLRRGNVDGALILSHHSASSSYGELARTLPIVFGVHPPGAVGDQIHVVDVDNVAVGALGTRHLVERGRQHIATITGPLDTSAGRERMQGWRDTVLAAGLEPGGCEEGDYTPTGGAQAMGRLLDAEAPFDAVFIASAQMASGAVAVLKDRGVRIPADVAVATADNNVFSTSSSPQLTTVDLHTAEKGATMMAAVVRLIDGAQLGTEMLVPIDLIERASTAL